MQRITRAQRLAVVERAIAVEGWSGDWLDRIAGEVGCSRRTIERDRDEVVARLRDLDLGPREDRRARLLTVIRAGQRSALEEGKLAPLAQLLGLETRILGLTVPPPEPLDAPPVEDYPTPRHRLLAEVRQLRREAEVHGRMTAVAQLLGREHALMTDIEEWERRQKEEEAATTSTEAFLAKFAATLRTLPPGLIDRLAELVDEHRRE